MNLAWLRLRSLLRASLPAACLAALLAGCGGGAPQVADAEAARALDQAPVDLDALADATPRLEPPSATGNDLYNVDGRRYRPLASSAGFVQRGLASWYGTDFHGRLTSTRERYDMYAMTAAHALLPLPSYARVTNLDNGRAVVVRINDRGPFVHGRVIDLSFAAAYKLDTLRRGIVRVEVRALPADGEADGDAPGDADGVDARAPADGNSSGDAGGDFVAATAGASGMLVQIGAYSQLGNARALRERMLQAGYRVAELTPTSDDTGTVYRVRIGPYASHPEAQAAQRKLATFLGWTGTLVQE
ncbi:MAG: septal ring lytic transglycosylase RlpA family protein [Gammaproteobacteria bacterium]